MKDLKIKTNPDVVRKFESYPASVRRKLKKLRLLIIDVAKELEEVKELEETLKWGEPSYIAKTGSTIRIDWKEKTPEQYAMYFKCTSKLVPSFKKQFGTKFNYEKNRAILFEMNDKVPEKQLKSCIALALKYHLVKKEL